MRDRTRRPLLEVMCDRLGPPQPRRGARSDRPWWHCPFHEDPNPSFCIVPGGHRWHCFGCRKSGDAIALILGLEPGMKFPQALAEAEGAKGPPRRSAPARRAVPPAPPRRSERPPGWQEFAGAIADEAARNLWSGPGGAPALAHLRGRGLADATIRAAGLGFWPADEFRRGLYPDGPVLVPRGVTIPWRDDGVVTALNVRRLEFGGEVSKYHLLRDSVRTLYPGRAAIVPGRPLIVTEGEFDALLVGQCVGAAAGVVTLGSAADRDPRSALGLAMAAATPWYIAGDSDSAGEANASHWLARSGRCRRVAPPAKDWTDAYRDGYRIDELWAEVFAGRDPDGFDPSWFETTDSRDT